MALVKSGAPQAPPKWAQLSEAMSALDVWDSAGIGLLIVLVAFGLETLQTPIVRLFEGYWGDAGPMGWLAGKRTEHWRKRREKLVGGSYSESADDRESILRADRRLQAEFPARERVLPTRLGNLLRAAEDSVGQRYGLQTVAVWPRLYPFIGTTLKAALDDVRDRLDTALRWSCYLLFGAIVSAALLLQYPLWWLLPATLTLLALGAYVSACTTAKGYGVLLATAFDLHRFDMLRAMRISLPADEAEEKATGQALSAFLTGQRDTHGLTYAEERASKTSDE
jgi:hypothetical protein